VSGYALKPPTNPSLFELANINQIVSSNIGDIRDYDLLFKILTKEKPEIIIHMAAQPIVIESYKNPRETYEVNVMGTVNLLEAIRKLDCVKAVLNITSDKCYENKEWYWGYRENEPLGGYDPYSNSKACSELVTSSFRNSFYNLKEYKKHGVAVATARAGNVIGGGDWAGERLIPDFIRSIIEGTNVKIRSPRSIRPWQHVLEPLNGYLLLCKKLCIAGPDFANAWNFGANDSDAKNVEWVINKLCSLWGNGARYELDKNPQPHEASFLKLDCSKSKKMLQWEPKWDLEKALQSIVDWNKAYLQKENMRLFSFSQIEEYFSSEV
jgi:CDP-glucose 4,6-dehydratase